MRVQMFYGNFHEVGPGLMEEFWEDFEMFGPPDIGSPFDTIYQLILAGF